MLKAAIDASLLSAPNTKGGILQRALLALIRGPKHVKADALPTSNRFLFYELVQMSVVEKDGGLQRPDDPVINALTHLREAGLVPWDWITDETRHLLQQAMARGFA